MPPTPTCPDHKKYQGKRRPRNGCSKCQDVYDYLHGILHPGKMKQIDKETIGTETISCKKHPKYKAVRKPKMKCEGCINFYNKKHGITTKKPKPTDAVPPPPTTSESLEKQHRGPWTTRKSEVLDSTQDFKCTRPIEVDRQGNGEKICGFVSFYIVRRHSDIYFKCTFCGRQYRAEAKEGELYYTQEPVTKGKSRIGDPNGPEDSVTIKKK